MNLFRKLLGLCVHEWSEPIRHEFRYEGRIVGFLFEWQCKKCGNVKTKKVIPL